MEDYGLVSADLLDSNGLGVFDGVNYSGAEYFRQCMNGNTYVSPPMENGENGFTIIVAAPVWANGVPNTQVVGVVCLVPSETFLNDIMQRVSM